MQMWQSVGAGGVLQPPKWSEYYKRPFNARIHTSCKVTAGPGIKCETDDGSGSARRLPLLPNTVRLKLAAFGAAQCQDGSVRSKLVSFVDVPAPACSWGGVRSADITMDASRGLWARVFSPASVVTTRALPVIVYFHGGGFVLFSAASGIYDALCRRLCRELGAVVVSVNYRLAPHHRFPAAYDDGVTALRYLYAANALPPDLVPVPIDVSSCFLAGDSAGGNIAHHVAQRWSTTSSSSSSPPPVNIRPLAGAIFIQPLFGGEERTRAELELANVCPSLTLASADYCWRQFLPESATRDHAAASCVCSQQDDVDDMAQPLLFPPAMVVTGGFDPLKDRHARYVEMLRENGGKPVQLVEYEDAIHGFYLFPEIADSGKLVADMKLFVEEHRSNQREV